MSKTNNTKLIDINKTLFEGIDVSNFSTTPPTHEERKQCLNELREFFKL